MRISTALVLTMVVVGLGFQQTSQADNSLANVLWITITGPSTFTLSGKDACRGRMVCVKNLSGGPLQVILKDGDGTTLINETIPNGEYRCATFKTTGTPSIQILPNPPQEPWAPLAEFCPGVPTLSEWAVVAMVFLLLAAGTIIFGRRRVSAGPN